jgi:hypothetical protein
LGFALDGNFLMPPADLLAGVLDGSVVEIRKERL